jgi:hypothetical protein
MSNFRVEITEQGNEALTGIDNRCEYARLMIDIANKIMSGYSDGPIIDSNGNKVGEWDIGDIEE